MDHDDYRTNRIPCNTRIDIRAWSVEVQGKRIKLTCKKSTPHKKRSKERGVITSFSRRARGRWLQMVASVNWRDAGPALFVTLTYPPEVENQTMEQRKQQRYQINRFIVKLIGEAKPMFWRVEWKPRLSGPTEGAIAPHMHLLYLKTPMIDETTVRHAWMRIIRVDRYTQVDVKEIPIADVVGVYVSKYCAKETSSLVLDNVSKRNRTGRHAGIIRRKRIPMHTLEKTEKINQAILSFLVGEACRTLWWYDPRFDEGFTIIGDKALEVIAKFHGLRVDLYGEEVYTE